MQLFVRVPGQATVAVELSGISAEAVVALQAALEVRLRVPVAVLLSLMRCVGLRCGGLRTLANSRTLWLR